MLLVAGFSLLLVGKLFLTRPGKQIALLKILFWVIGGLLYAFGLFGQAATLLGLSGPYTWLVSLAGTCVSVWIICNMILHAIGLKYKPDEILGSPAKVIGEWEDGTGIIEIELNGHVFTRIASSDTHHKENTMVEIIEVDAKIGRVKVRDLNMKKSLETSDK